MSAVNGLVGANVPPLRSVANEEATDVLEITESDGFFDGTEWVVAFLVLGALGVIILFRAAGFQGMIAAKASLGG